MEHISIAMTRLYLVLGLVLGAPRVRDERGDVPGWVMITVMTAGLVVAITAVAQPQLKSMLDSALNQVK